MNFRIYFKMSTKLTVKNCQYFTRMNTCISEDTFNLRDLLDMP